MKYLILFALLATVAAAPAQVAQVGGRHNSKAGDQDDSGVLPFSMATPYGTAKLYVHESGMAALVLNGMLWVDLLANMPLPPGMIEATVDGGLCDVVYIPNPIGLPTIASTPLGPSTANTLEGAVADYKQKMENAVGELLPCP